MSVKVTWPASEELDIASYDLESSVSLGGPWSLLINVPHTSDGANWDPVEENYFFVDSAGTEATFYRLTVIDDSGQRSAPSVPFRVPSAIPPGGSALSRKVEILTANVSTLIALGFNCIEIWRSNDESSTWQKLETLLLVPGVYSYHYYDSAPSSISRYRWRYSNGGVAPFSAFSQWVTGTQPSRLAPDKLSVAYATFIGLDGRAERAKLIVSLKDGAPAVVSGMVVAPRTTQVYEADDNGFIEVVLVRGSKVVVGIENTGFVREFTVPDSPSFDILSVMSTIPDQFSVQVPLPMLNRRSI